MRSNLGSSVGSVLVLLALVLFGTGCAVIRPGEVGVKQRFGRLKPRNFEQGLYALNPFTTRMLKIPTRTRNFTSRYEDIPSKEGLNISVELSVLYSFDGRQAQRLVQEVGLDYERVLLTNVFRSAIADMSARFYSADLYTSKRDSIEIEIKHKIGELLSARGFVIENVLLKSIVLPAGLAAAIENKLEAEQLALRMQFVLQRERQEAERKVIEAKGIRDAQVILLEGLNPMIIQYQSIQAFKDLAASPNAKIIVTDGKAPFLIGTTESTKDVPITRPTPASPANRNP
jgi:prohibitin 1